MRLSIEFFTRSAVVSIRESVFLSRGPSFALARFVVPVKDILVAFAATFFVVFFAAFLVVFFLVFFFAIGVSLFASLLRVFGST